MANTDKIDLEAASQALGSGMSAYLESTGKLPVGQDLSAMEDLVVQQQMNAQDGK